MNYNDRLHLDDAFGLRCVCVLIRVKLYTDMISAMI